MFGQLGLKLKVYGGIAAAFVAFYLFTTNDLKTNYTVVQASITKVTVDCFIKSRRRKIVDPKTKKLAYMDCKIAPLVADKHKYPDFRIQKRAIVQYRYTSLVDSRMYDGSFETSGSTVKDTFVPGATIQIRAHKTEPAESRGFSFTFDEDNAA